MCKRVFSGAAIEPHALYNIFTEQKAKRYKRDADSRNVSGMLTTHDFSKQVCGDLTEFEKKNRLTRLQFDLQIEAQKLGIRLPIQNLLDPVCAASSTCEDFVNAVSLPDVIVDVDLPVCAVLEACNRPPSMVELVPCKFVSVLSDGFIDAKARFLSNLYLNEEQKTEIKLLCNGQSNSEFWKIYKTGCITSSVAHQVVKFVARDKTDPVSLIKKIMFYNAPFRSLPTQWGIEHETSGINSLVKFLSETGHVGLVVERPGLLIHKEFVYIRGSPDVIVRCQCCEMEHLGEIKCPYSCRYSSVDESIQCRKLSYLISRDDGVVQLKPNDSRGYYAQVQLLMALLEVDCSYVVIWTTVDSMILRVQFDDEYWNTEMLPNMKAFFNTYIVDELLTERVKRGISLNDVSAHEM